MYPDWAFGEFYPNEIVKKVLRENPRASIEQLHGLMQAEWDAVKPKHDANHVMSMAELAEELRL